MEQTQLRAQAGSGDQQTAGKTNLAQPATGSNAGGTPISQVQPGVAASSLTTSSQTGIALSGQGALPSVSLGPTTATITQPVKAAVIKPHHISALWLSLPVLLIIVAVAVIWQSARAAKSTTYY